MTLSPDEQPLTRRQLRELERTMPKKDRQDPAKVQEEAARRAAETDAATPEQAPADSTESEAPQAAEPAEASDVTGASDVTEASGVNEPAEPTHASDVNEVVEDAVVVEEPPQAVPGLERDDSEATPSPVGARGASDPISSFAPEAAEQQPIIEELVIDDQPVDTTPIDDVPIDDDPDDGDSLTEITIEPLSSGPILAPIFQPPAAGPDEQAPARVDDADASFDDLISSRTVGSTNSSQTSALVLPAVPSSMDMGTALDETGEVIITGSIDLPSSMGSNGAPAAGIESKDLDALLEVGETEQSGDDVAPVSASRAVSTGASNNALVAPPKRGRVNVPVVLAITAGILAIGVVGLLLAAFVFRIF
jgi:hypothetical protein